MIGLEVAYHKILRHDRIFALNMRKFQFILPKKNYIYIKVQLLENALYLNEGICGTEISNSIFCTHDVIISIWSTVLYTAGIH